MQATIKKDGFQVYYFSVRECAISHFIIVYIRPCDLEQRMIDMRQNGRFEINAWKPISASSWGVHVQLTELYKGLELGVELSSGKVDNIKTFRQSHNRKI